MSISALPWAVLIAALLGSFVASWQASRAAHARAESHFLEQSAEMGAAVQARLDLYLALVRSTAGLFVASERVTPDEFATFVERLGLSDEYRGVRAISVVPRVSADRIGEFESVLTQIHGRHIAVWPRTDAEEVFPLAVIEPLDAAKLTALGFDLGSHPGRRSTLERARDTAELSASAPLIIVEAAPTPNRGFLVALPLYGTGVAGWEALLGGRTDWRIAPENRRETLRGFIVGAFLADEMVGFVRERRAGRPLPLAIYDGDTFDQNSLLYASPEAGDPDQAAGSERVDFAGRTWTILFFHQPGAAGWAGWLGLGRPGLAESRLVPIIALLGLGFSLALFLVTRAQVRARSAAERAALEAQQQRSLAAESERRFRTLADAAPVLIWMAAPDGGILWVNLATLEFTGRSMEQLVGEGWLGIVHGDDRQRAGQVYREALKARRPYASEFRARRADGEHRWLLATGRPVLHASGVFAGYIGIGMDITDQKLAMERLHEQTRELEAVNTHLERLNTELARSNLELADFAAIAAHDLKEPLRGMANYARFVREDYGASIPQQGLDMLETLERLASRLTRLLEALLEYARVGRGELHLESTDLNEICRHVAEGLSVHIAQPDVELECRPLPTVRCDPMLVSLVYSNLIVNGLKYNSSPVRRVEVGTLQTDDGPILYVRDNGIGIPPQHHERIFKMFKRLHGREAFGGGLGAGLAIVKKIIERHGGRIWIASEVGRGTTFYFTLTPQPRSMPPRGDAVAVGVPEAGAVQSGRA
jgi:PAS domain S-box-containing protein